jgi:thiamine biosynthesis lipoprotein
MALIAAAALLFIWPGLAGGGDAAPAREARLVMGALAQVEASGLPDPARGLDAAFAELQRVDDRMTLYRPSELTTLNHAGEARLSEDTASVLWHALEMSYATGGAFDPTVEPLVRASGHIGGQPRRLTRCERWRLLARVGTAHVHLDPATRQVRLDPGTRLDFGGIAKGYAVDRALAALREAGARAGLVDLGGSSLGVFGAPTTVAVRDPESPDGPPWATFTLDGGALASSGGDQRPGHILDPRTGLPARKVLATTVVARSAMEADALSTAVFVLGAEEGQPLLARRGAAGLVLSREQGRPVIRASPGFAEAHGLRAAEGVTVRP